MDERQSRNRGRAAARSKRPRQESCLFCRVFTGSRVTVWRHVQEEHQAELRYFRGMSRLMPDRTRGAGSHHADLSPARASSSRLEEASTPEVDVDQWAGHTPQVQQPQLQLQTGATISPCLHQHQASPATPLHQHRPCHAAPLACISTNPAMQHPLSASAPTQPCSTPLLHQR